MIGLTEQLDLGGSLAQTDPAPDRGMTADVVVDHDVGTEGLILLLLFLLGKIAQTSHLIQRPSLKF